MDSILAVDSEPNLAFQGILHSVFHRLEAGEGVAIAFTSAGPGEGVTYVSKKIASQLSASSSGAALYLSSTQLCRDSWQDGAKQLDGYKLNEETGSRTAWEDWRSKVSTAARTLPLLDHRLPGAFSQQRCAQPGSAPGWNRGRGGGERYP